MHRTCTHTHTQTHTHARSQRETKGPINASTDTHTLQLFFVVIHPADASCSLCPDLRGFIRRHFMTVYNLGILDYIIFGNTLEIKDYPQLPFLLVDYSFGIIALSMTGRQCGVHLLCLITQLHYILLECPVPLKTPHSRVLEKYQSYIPYDHPGLSRTWQTIAVHHGQTTQKGHKSTL
ncbi:hypothetical protein C0J50_19831 [Silurus asotus]|uniref:Uncharacterized protein n=1 Tax=Silurus asotus TaxID=30991 RepID=A0AAD5ARB9_SILAS|nr:hypothetical protein C0J50_19831 [Silurus asotus]